MPDEETQRWHDQDEINLLDYWRVIWKYKWLIGGLCSVSVIAALIFSLLSPKIYESKATMLTPKEGAGSGILSAMGASGLLQQVAGVSLPSLTPNRDMFLSVLKSRTIARGLVEEFKLKDYYKVGHPDEAIRVLQGATKVTVTKEGLIEVKVEDTDPKIAADLANAYITHLDRLTMQFNTGMAGGQRRFLSEQLAKTQNELKASEEALRQFQERNRAYLVGDMANSMRLPGAQVPKVQLEFARLARDLKVQEAVYTILTQQLEQAKMTEAQDIPIVHVLDRAVPALHKSGPKIRLNMAFAGAGSLFLGIFLAFFLEYIQRQREAAGKLGR